MRFKTGGFLQYEANERLDFPILPDHGERWEHNLLREEQAELRMPVQPLRFQDTPEEVELDQRSRAPAAFWRQPLYSRLDSGSSNASTTAQVRLLCPPSSPQRTQRSNKDWTCEGDEIHCDWEDD